MVSLSTPPAGQAVSPKQMNRRLWWLGATQGLIGLIVLSAVHLRPTIPYAELAYTVLLAGVVAVQSVLRVDRGSPHRRVFESFWEVPLVLALFGLSPTAVFVGFMAGEIIGCFLLPSMTLVRAFCNLTREFAIVPVLLAVVQWLDPDGVFDQPAAILVPVAVWIVLDLLRLIAYPVSAWARWGEVRWGLASDYLATSPHRLMAALLGYFVVLAAAEGPASLVGAVVLLGLFLLIVRRATIAHSLSVGFEKIAGFSERTHGLHNPAEVEQMLTDAVSNVGSFDTYAVASADEQGDISWQGVVQSAMLVHFPDLDLISASGYGRPLACPSGKGSFGVWPIDPRRRSFLVASHLSRQDFQALLPAIDYLVNHARLAIESVYDRRSLVEAAEREYRRARLDERTDLPNRLAAEEHLAAIVSDSPDRDRTLIGVSLLGLAEMVAVLGREVGDQEVANFAQSVLAVVTDDSSIEYVANIGLQQFLVVANAPAGELDRLTKRLAAPRTAVGRAQQGGEPAGAAEVREAAVGVVSVSALNQSTGDELLRCVDQAVERATADGRVVYFGQQDVDDEARRMSIRMRLPEAISAGRITANFQPQIDLASGGLAGVEVLARWTDDTLGVVGPGEFVPIAERSGQIDALTRSIAEQAMIACAGWRGAGFEVPFSVNVSALSLAGPDLVERIVRLVERHAVPVGLVTIELTESVLATGSESRLALLERLRSSGFKISIDDFGTGYSALAYLDQLPIDEIKIDRSMVVDLHPADSRMPVLTKLVELCGELGFSVVAEGVETDTELAVLRSIGCDIGQGYIFSKPMSSHEMTSWLARFLSSPDGSNPDASTPDRFGSEVLSALENERRSIAGGEQTGQSVDCPRSSPGRR